MPSIGPLVELRLYRRKNGSRYYIVAVRSEKNPVLKKLGMLEHGMYSNERGALGILAGALAEQLCAEYADTLNPSDAARAAERAYVRLMNAQRIKIDPGEEPPRDADRALATDRDRTIPLPD